MIKFDLEKLKSIAKPRNKKETRKANFRKKHRKLLIFLNKMKLYVHYHTKNKKKHG